jgi:hypothetical protein
MTGAARPPGQPWRDADGLHVDVRGLAPPAPFVVIVKLVDSVRDATPVIVHHDRDPKPLYPELAERGWTVEHIHGEPGEVRLRLVRAG